MSGTGSRFFFKQWGGRNKKAAGRMLDGRTWDEMPGLFQIGIERLMQRENRNS
ncbi:MAG TPA: DUF5131 family protein [Gemmataceae bacterium]|nr:DUF5131 family protein [Gemmataceae bacterium]